MNENYYKNIVVNEYSKAERSGMKPGLDRIFKLLDLIGNPQNKLTVIHVAGTNGKGSVCNYLHSILSTKYKVGMYTSPSLMELNDRIKIDKSFISYKEIYNYYNKFKNLWIDNCGLDDFPTFFEIFTAIALYYFVNNNVDFAIIEVGLGGKNDATNIFKNKLASIITKIGYDHMNILGDDIIDITKEKLGIIDNSKFIISYPQIAEVENFMRNFNGNIDFIKETDVKNIKLYKDSVVFDYKNLDNIHLPMIGQHQAINCSVALECINKLNSHRIIEIGHSKILEALSKTKWPGRLEWFGNILIDGAHNIDGINALMSYLTACKFKKIKLLFGMLSDKDYTQVINKLENLDAESFITNVPNFVNNTDLLVKAFTKPVRIYDEYSAALDELIPNLDDDEVLVITGSLYLISEVRKYLEVKDEIK